MEPNQDEIAGLRESFIRLESKIDVVLTEHRGQLNDLNRRQGEQRAVLTSQQSDINALQLANANSQAQITGLKQDHAELRAEVGQNRASRGSQMAAWAAVCVATLAVVLDPLLTAMLRH